MRWIARRRLILILIGSVALALSIVVWIINQSISSDVLAAVGVLGGIAIVINSLPENGESLK